ncbi:MAG TPA: endonuclease MutS2 [Vicinamibacterales bacterium]|jgi:DNA mismatch repair protein MutS2|nr:endonuclease MutS2 [Vicinamibacterales bacterium]
MQPGALRALEFDRIVEAVTSFALTPMGGERLARLAPSTDPHKVAQLLAATSETGRFIAAHGLFPLRATSDLPPILSALAVEGRPLEAPRLLTLAAFLDSIDESRIAIRRQAASFPLLDAASGGAASFKDQSAQVRDKIDPSGEVVDDASPQLKGIRDRLRKQRARLRTTLESYLRGKETAKYLQDQVVTERNGRYVLVVKAEHRSGIPGIVHGSSTSGASLFLEPLSTVEINNDIVALEQQETEEIRRILLALTDAFRQRAADLARTIEAATELDVLQGRARFSDSIDAIEPALSTDGAFELQAARHPLLIRRAEAPGESKNPVPVTIKIIPPATVLLITGPNTGGKTVALKTAGLLALMAQAGLRIPAADGSRVPVFRSIFADIGDEQSIDASLSTFSGHITNIASMDRSMAAPALVLLDEVGSGTDPIEGGALGVAIVDHFRRRGATVIATSHYDALKTYASTTDGVATAAFGFDTETFAPTYQLMYGSPGRSLALEIAGRLGLNPSVITQARENLSAREAQLAEHLAKIDRDMRALEHEQRLAAKERETLADADVRMRQREDALRQREETFRRRLTEELDTQVREARREIDAVIAELKAKTDAMALEAGRQTSAVTTGDTGAARSDARAAVEDVGKRVLAGAAGAPEGSPEIRNPQPAIRNVEVAVGDRVIVGGLGLEAIVTGVHDGTADLDVRGKRMRASLRDLKTIASGGGAAPPAKVNVHVALQPRETTASDLNVIGCTVDEAIARAERFLDESLLTDQRVVRLIHGYGTGQLKRALTGFLQQHPLVARFATAPPEQGGGGVTVVELKD